MRIVILAPPGVQSLDVVGPAEVFWEAARRLGSLFCYHCLFQAAAADMERVKRDSSCDRLR